jgi:hypothetical protein
MRIGESRIDRSVADAANPLVPYRYLTWSKGLTGKHDIATTVVVGARCTIGRAIARETAIPILAPRTKTMSTLGAAKFGRDEGTEDDSED